MKNTAANMAKLCMTVCLLSLAFLLVGVKSQAAECTPENDYKQGKVIKITPKSKPINKKLGQNMTKHQMTMFLSKIVNSPTLDAPLERINTAQTM